ncbi:WAT1-related protein isoform X1 [Tanacetum coccineum]|uniref:WAT1-related protein isoform X1 n=1 Tax=Tanacetum coccineum TaxID=301880 RepID=A0ABQ5D1K7_9ASTR
MKEYVGMVGTQVAQVLLMVYSKAAIADGMSSYSFIFYSNALASLILLPLSFIIHSFLAQIFGYTGVSLSSATLGTTLLNLIPGCTFVLAIICRDPAILPSTLKSEITNNLLAQPSNWVLGGILLSVDAVFASMYIISQAFVLKKYPAVVTVMFSYCFICTILSGLASFIVEADLSGFNLQPKNRLFSVLYSVSRYYQLHWNK